MFLSELSTYRYQKCIYKKRRSFFSIFDSESDWNITGSNGTRSSLGELLNEELQATGCTSNFDWTILITGQPLYPLSHGRPEFSVIAISWNLIKFWSSSGNNFAVFNFTDVYPHVCTVSLTELTSCIIPSSTFQPGQGERETGGGRDVVCVYEREGWVVLKVGETFLIVYVLPHFYTVSVACMHSVTHY